MTITEKIQQNIACDCGRRNGDGFNEECKGDLCQYYKEENDAELRQGELSMYERAVRFNITIEGIDVTQKKEVVYKAELVFNSLPVRQAIDDLVQIIIEETGIIFSLEYSV